MKKIKLAMALTTAMVASSAVNATNQVVNVKIGVTAYIAAGLSTEVTPMVFGAVVAPTAGSSELKSYVEILCNGEFEYSANGSPVGTGANTSGTQNIGAPAPDPVGAIPAMGAITISGEPNYAISVDVTSDTLNQLPQEITFSPELDTATCAGTGAGNTALDGNGDLVLNLFGKLEVDNGYAGGETVVTNALVTINYR